MCLPMGKLSARVDQNSLWSLKRRVMLKTYWADLLDPKDPLMNVRKKGWDLFEKIGLPRPKQEAFQYLVQKLVFPPLAERKNIVIGPAGGLAERKNIVIGL